MTKNLLILVYLFKEKKMIHTSDEISKENHFVSLQNIC